MKKFLIILTLACLQLTGNFLFSKIDEKSNTYELATFGGGCFWCMQSDFDSVQGVIETTVGFMGGTKPNPTYGEVSSGKTGYVEVVQMKYDPAQVSYENLLNIYFHNIDPTRDDGQFCDQGKQYRPVIFYEGDNQKALAEAYKQKLIDAKKVSPILVQIVPAKTFYPAEKYHQKYYKKNPLRYKFYRYSCGRDKRLKELWDKHD